LCQALVHREQAAEREQDQRHDERPEEHRLAPAQRVVGLGGRFACCIPQRSSAWLPLSAKEWIASASIALEPVRSRRRSSPPRWRGSRRARRRWTDGIGFATWSYTSQPETYAS
jgi:hypothetical protein